MLICLFLQWNQLKIIANSSVVSWHWESLQWFHAGKHEVVLTTAPPAGVVQYFRRYHAAHKNAKSASFIALKLVTWQGAKLGELGVLAMFTDASAVDMYTSFSFRKDILKWNRNWTITHPLECMLTCSHIYVQVWNFHYEAVPQPCPSVLLQWLQNRKHTMWNFRCTKDGLSVLHEIIKQKRLVHRLHH